MSLVRFPVTPLKTPVDAFCGGLFLKNVLHMYYILQNEPENLTIYGLNTNFICTTALAEVYAKVVNYLIP